MLLLQAWDRPGLFQASVSQNAALSEQYMNKLRNNFYFESLKLLLSFKPCQTL